MQVKTFRFGFAAIAALALLSVPMQVNAQDTATAEPAAVQDDGPKAYDFEIVKNCERTEVKSQDRTGTCWSFATASFIESEALRMGKGKHNLSEMFIVQNIYKDKASNYILRHGKAQFSEGALAHDFLNAAGRHGIVPDDVYDGLDEGVKQHDHSELVDVLTGMVEKYSKRKKLSPKWQSAVANVLSAYLGKAPENFQYRDRSYTPKEFAKELGFERDNYVSLSSYTHHPFNKDFVLEIPDNFSNGSFHNVKIDDMIATIDNAIEKGYTVAWDGDVSEKGFNSGRGIAILPKNPNRRDAFTNIGEEKEVTQEMRQDTFMTFSTTDDHLMHLVGISKDAAGNKYYVIKNSWGSVGPYAGYLHMSEAYVRLKTVAVIVHKDAVISSASK